MVAYNKPADPFKDPILAALRGRKMAESTRLTSGNEEGVVLYGDWNALGRSSLGAEKLLRALVHCFREEGIEPSSPGILLEQTGKKPQIELDEHGHMECMIAMGFDTDKYSYEQIGKALHKIVVASKEMEARAVQMN